MTDHGDEGAGRFGAWSRRKLAAKRREAEAAEKDAVAADEIQPEGATTEEPAFVPPVDPDYGDPDVVDALPSLDDITAGYDIKPFLAKGVPAKLKNAAMRKLWLASPSVRDYADPAVDYAWDWNAPGGVPGGGGVLSERSVAKMVQDLIKAPPKPAEDPVDAEVVEPSALSVAQEDGDAQGDTREDPPADVLPPDPVRRSGHPPNSRDKQAFEDKKTLKAAAGEPKKADLEIPAPRRHGGAVPE
jgi:hypothetical protein